MRKQDIETDGAIETHRELTFMATLGQIMATGLLDRYHPELEPHEQPQRIIYMTPEARAWCEHTLPALPNDRSRNLTPQEQVSQLLYDFVIGRPMVYNQGYKPLRPQTKNIWELRTTDVRLIGWFPRRATFVVVCARPKQELREGSLYTPCVNHSEWFGNNLDLDPPKFLVGKTANDVL
jgi:hypothetical protein